VEEMREGSEVVGVWREWGKVAMGDLSGCFCFDWV
jgi:hypothetical protein